MADKQAMTIDVLGMTNEIRKMLTEHTRLLLDQYKTIRGLYGTPNKSIMDVMLEFWPEGTKQFFQSFDEWLNSQMQTYENTIDDSFTEYTKNIRDLEFTAPNIEHYRMLVDEHTKLWIENYKTLKERREQASREAFESLKKMLPVSVHPVLETMNLWITEQNERFEEEFLKSIRKLTSNYDSNKD